MKKHGRPSEYESAIAAIVKDAPRGTHLTAPEVYAKARDCGLPVSISTVYRTLQRLKEVGNLSTVSGNRKLRYESAEEGPEHDHLICLNCGLTIEFIDERLPNFGEAVAKNKGFVHTKSRFDILGICAQCRSSGNSSTKAKMAEHWQSASISVKDALNGLLLVKESLSREDLTEQEMKDLFATNELIKLKLKKAVENCEAVDSLIL
jgi:Fur family ferric uptake transcriptional regulator